MKKFVMLFLAFAMASMANASLMITNGDFEEGAVTGNQTDVLSWFDSAGTEAQETNNEWWAGSWYGPTVSPTGTSAMGFSDWNTPWAYQAIGVNEEALTEIEVELTIGSFTDAGVLRDLTVLVELFMADSSFVGADGTDIAASMVALSSFTISGTQLAAGETITDSGILDLSATNSVDQLYIRLSNANAGTGESWVGVDDVNIVPEPATLSLLGMGALALRRRRA